MGNIFGGAEFLYSHSIRMVRIWLFHIMELLPWDCDWSLLKRKHRGQVSWNRPIPSLKLGWSEARNHSRYPTRVQGLRDLNHLPTAFAFLKWEARSKWSSWSMNWKFSILCQSASPKSIPFYCYNTIPLYPLQLSPFEVRCSAFVPLYLSGIRTSRGGVVPLRLVNTGRTQDHTGRKWM